MSAAISVEGEPRVVYGRDAYVPEWSPRFSDADLDADVKQNGQPLGFKLRDVLPERRWAVTEGGELMSQRDFEDQYLRFAERVVYQGRIISVRSQNPYYDPKLGHIPRVEAFVNVAHDYLGREIRIGFDPNKPPEKKAANAAPQPAPTATPQVLRVQLETLASLKESGVLSDEQFSAEVSRLLTVPAPQPPAGPPPGFALVEPAHTEPEAAAAAPAEVFAAKCGRECASKAGRAAHERNCDDCKAAANDAEEIA